MTLRVIAGKAKGRKLKMVPGEGTRPIMDRVKEALFNILRLDVYNAKFLDLFAGTGSVGIEALSRGTAFARFVENARIAQDIISDNLRVTGFTNQADIVRQSVFDYLQQPALQAFDIVYIAPPQYKNLWLQTLQALDAQPDHVAVGGIVAIQIDPTEKHMVNLQNFVPFDERKYGNTLLWFFKRTASTSTEE